MMDTPEDSNHKTYSPELSYQGNGHRVKPKREEFENVIKLLETMANDFDIKDGTYEIPDEFWRKVPGNVGQIAESPVLLIETTDIALALFEERLDSVEKRLAAPLLVERFGADKQLLRQANEELKGKVIK